MGQRERAGIRLRWAIIILTLISLGLIIYTHWNHEIEEYSFSPVIGGVSEAIFVAGALGLTLDQALKARLVKDVATEALRSSWGVNAPQEYIENLSTSLAGYNRIMLSLEVRLELTIHDRTRGTVQAKVHTRTVTQNISGIPWDTPLPGATPSAYSCPDSEICDFELTVQNPSTGQRAPKQLHRHWDSTELRDAYERTSTGALKVKKGFDSSPWTYSVKPGGTAEARYTSIVYYRNEDVISLATSAPALSWELLLSVDEALKDLDIRAFIGGDKKELQPHARGQHVMAGFTHAGATMQIVWAPKRQEQTALPEVTQGRPPDSP
ncbi:hypothetical protein [Streptomyces sp. C10-9-1]|uniref:hypothetical protein n=1 Tax=Streptomyces sp. C10-9-1 TaxID=1859285 RepID=UPI003D708F29